MTINTLSPTALLYLSGVNNNNPSTGNPNAVGTPTTNDSSQLSPFAQLMNTLQQLQQTNPTQFQQLTGQLATDLTQAAKTAQSNGNITEANALNQLAASFNQASQTGQLPSFMQQGTTNAETAGHHHHHHHHGGGAQGLNQDLNSISQSILSNLDPASTSTSTNTGSSNSQQ